MCASLKSGCNGKVLDLSYKQLISPEECEQIVGVENSTIMDYRVSKIPEHIGFLGEYLRLEVVVEDDDGVRSTERYFVKSLPIVDQNQRAMMEELGFFRKEVGIYSEILAGFGHNEGSSKWRPDCYLTRKDLIVLEDLEWHQDFKMVHFQSVLDHTYLHLVLDKVAHMHAVSLNYEYNYVGGKRLDDLYGDLLYETSIKRDNTWFIAGLSGIKAIALNGTKYCKDPVKRQIINHGIEDKLLQVFEAIQPTTKFQNVLVHRDIWLNNIMFQFEKDPETGKDNLNAPITCVLMDFQLCRYLPPIVDFLLLLYLTTRRSHREKFFQHYLRYYYDTLSAKTQQFNLDLNQILSWDQLLRSLDHYKIIAHVVAGIYQSLTNLPSNVLDDLHRDDPELYHQVCNYNRDEFILKYLREDEFYRDTMTECVEETLEYLFGFGTAQSSGINGYV